MGAEMSRSRLEIARVVEELGRLNDRRLLANEMNDLAELEAVAQEYERRRMVRMARDVRISIDVRKENNHHA